MNTALHSALEEYAYNFPFETIPDREINTFLASLDGTLCPTLESIFKTIGRGAYFMTYPFFVCDSTLTHSIRLRELLDREGIVTSIDRVLCIGNALDACSFFVEDWTQLDPLVHCYQLIEKQVLGSFALSSVVLGLRGFPDCRGVPQEIFDYHWYEKHHADRAQLNATDLGMRIHEWSLTGRGGMEERFKGHPLESDCDFPPKGSIGEPQYFFSPYV